MTQPKITIDLSKLSPTLLNMIVRDINKAAQEAKQGGKA